MDSVSWEGGGATASTGGTHSHTAGWQSARTKYDVHHWHLAIMNLHTWSSILPDYLPRLSVGTPVADIVEDEGMILSILVLEQRDHFCHVHL